MPRAGWWGAGDRFRKQGAHSPDHAAVSSGFSWTSGNTTHKPTHEDSLRAMGHARRSAPAPTVKPPYPFGGHGRSGGCATTWPRYQRNHVKILKIVALSAALAAAALLSGASWASKAHAACSNTYKQVPWDTSYHGDPNNIIRAGEVDFSCNANDVGEFWVNLDYLDQLVYPYRWTWAATVYHASGVHLNGGWVTNGIWCSQLSMQYYRTRVWWDNWTTNTYGNQAWTASSSGLLC